MNPPAVRDIPAGHAAPSVDLRSPAPSALAAAVGTRSELGSGCAESLLQVGEWCDSAVQVIEQGSRAAAKALAPVRIAALLLDAKWDEDRPDVERDTLSFQRAVLHVDIVPRNDLDVMMLLS